MILRRIGRSGDTTLTLREAMVRLETKALRDRADTRTQKSIATWGEGPSCARYRLVRAGGA